MATVDEGTGYEIAFGTFEEAKAMVGQATPVRFGRVEVNAPMIQHFSMMTEDANASYWDEEYAVATWGALVSPPAMLMVWLMPLEWDPEGSRPEPLLTARVPLPGTTFVNASTDTEFFAPMRVGDHLNVVEEVVDVSEEKKTALGVGHFVTTLSTYRRQDGQLVAKNTNVLFRFGAEEEGS
ncbi:MAG TPA: MaoC family dehydratase N-terminal domain-containing protein [Acidimicrobiales bacterium]|nr:MaoC family dehydratase N-terminal domain-containing protein [Acidimicrobiales bacterium]